MTPATLPNFGGSRVILKRVPECFQLSKKKRTQQQFDRDKTSKDVTFQNMKLIKRPQRKRKHTDLRHPNKLHDDDIQNVTRNCKNSTTKD
jgi:hypothetical protein